MRPVYRLPHRPPALASMLLGWGCLLALVWSPDSRSTTDGSDPARQVAPRAGASTLAPGHEEQDAATVGRGRGHPKDMRCDACHTPEGWVPARFAHERTGYPLAGQHARVSCVSCHTQSWTAPTPQGCAACHTDPHVQEFGTLCQSCHTEQNWHPLFAVEAHRRTQFPLSGRHAVIPCQECHLEKRDRTFTRNALSCASCHAQDARMASARTLDHQRLSQNCQTCHSPLAFAPARLPEHNACFPLVGSTHAAVRCADCHVAGTLAGARFSGTCREASLKCASCHAHDRDTTERQHQRVAGYAHESERCVACHRGGR